MTSSITYWCSAEITGFHMVYFWQVVSWQGLAVKGLNEQINNLAKVSVLWKEKLFTSVKPHLLFI
jgi:hypothetical protein